MNSDLVVGPSQKYSLAVLPLVGVALTSAHQIGQLAFYNVPYQLMEFSTVSTLVSAVALTIVGGAALLSLAIAYKRGLRSWWQRAAQHVALAVMLTGPFWAESLSFGAGVSWATLGLIALLAIAGYLAEGYYRGVQSGEDSLYDLQTRAERALHVVLVLGFVGLVCSFALGYNSAKEMPTRLFVQGTNNLVVGSYNGRLLVKRYDPGTTSIEDGTITVLELTSDVVLEERRATIAKLDR